MMVWRKIFAWDVSGDQDMKEFIASAGPGDIWRIDHAAEPPKFVWVESVLKRSATPWAPSMEIQGMWRLSYDELKAAIQDPEASRPFVLREHDSLYVRLTQNVEAPVLANLKHQAWDVKPDITSVEDLKPGTIWTERDKDSGLRYYYWFETAAVQGSDQRVDPNVDWQGCWGRQLGDLLRGGSHYCTMHTRHVADMHYLGTYEDLVANPESFGKRPARASLKLSWDVIPEEVVLQVPVQRNLDHAMEFHVDFEHMTIWSPDDPDIPKEVPGRIKIQSTGLVTIKFRGAAGNYVKGVSRQIIQAYDAWLQAQQGKTSALKLSWDVQPDIPPVGTRVRQVIKFGLAKEGEVMRYDPEGEWRDHPDWHGDLWIQYEDGYKAVPASHWSEWVEVIQ